MEAMRQDQAEPQSARAYRGLLGTHSRSWTLFAIVVHLQMTFVGGSARKLVTSKIPLRSAIMCSRVVPTSLMQLVASPRQGGHESRYTCCQEAVSAARIWGPTVSLGYRIGLARGGTELVAL